MKKSMACHFDEDLFVLVHGKQSPNDADWNDYLSVLRREASRTDFIKTLVFTDGGGPDGGQRKRLNDVLAGRATRVCVLTSSIIARAIVGTLAVFNPKIRAFSPDHAGLALAFLQVPVERYRGIRQTIAQLRTQLDTSDTCVTADDA